MLLNAFIRRDHLVLRLLLVLALIGVGNTQTQSFTTLSTAVVTLSASASPSTGQPGTILVNLTGSNFPSGTISPANVTVTLVPAVAGSGPTLSVVASTVTTITGTTRRVTFQVPPSPSLAPNVAPAGSTLTVKITAASANLVQGITTANFGAGVSVGGAPAGASGPVKVLSPTTATAQLAVDPAASAGARSVTLQVSSQSVPLADRFVVTTGSTSLLVAPGISVQAPMAYLAAISGKTSVGTTFTSGNEAKLTIEPDASVVSVAPNGGMAGQSVTATITAQYTNFVQGATKASFGPGISVGGAAEGSLGTVTVTSPTTATAHLTIDPAALSGPRTVSVATGVQQAALINAFSVIAPPSVTLNPNSGQQGQSSLAVAITGQNTHFVQGTTTVSFGVGVTVTSVTVSDATHLTVVLTIAPTTLGPQNVNVTTGTEVANSVFTVTPASQPPVLTSVVPNAGQQGQLKLSVAIAGQFTHFVQGTTTASFGAGVTVTSLTVTSPTGATALLNIDPAASIGARDVTLTTNPEVATLAGGFTVTAGTPVLLSVIPNSGQQGQQNLSVAITGEFTHFAQGTTLANFGNGVNVASLTVNSPTTATAVLDLRPAPNGSVTATFFPATDYNANTAAMDATLGITGYTVDTFETTDLIPGLTIQLSGAVPTTNWTSLPNLFDENTCPPLHQNQAWDGTHTALNQITNQSLNCTAPPGVANRITFNYAPGATSFGIGLSNFQSVNPPSPQFPVTNHELFVNGVDMGVIETLAGPAWSPGLVRNAYLRIDGINGGSITSVAFENLPGGAIEDGLMFDHLAVLPVPIGARDVTMITNAEVVTLTNGFTVTPRIPTITSVNPNTGQQGQQHLSVAITGLLTTFVQGTTVANFGAGITVASLTVTTPTTATAVINIDPAAVLGVRDVTLTSNTEVATLPSGFTVTAGTVNQPPKITSTPPTSPGPNWTMLAPTGPFPEGRRTAGANPQNYDALNDRMMFFSGDHCGCGTASVTLPDVWVLANASAAKAAPAWMQVTPSTPGPVGRLNHAMAYAPQTNRLIIQGGLTTNPAQMQFVLLADTWALTNANGLGGPSTWIRLPDIPVTREDQAAVYDQTTNRMVVFGGDNGADFNDVWVLTDADGNGTPTWVPLSPTGTAPTARENPSVAYDAVNNRLIVFGGLNRNGPVDFNDVWVLTNANGTGGAPQWIPLTPGGNPPQGRLGASLVYDPTSNTVTMFGGASGGAAQQSPANFNDVWTLSNANGLGGTPQWIQVSATGGPPIARINHAAALSNAGKMIVAMGRGGPATQTAEFQMNDVWVFSATPPLGINATESQVFSYQVMANDPDGDTLTYSLDVSPAGMTINSASGLIQWTPAGGQVGPQNVTVRVSDTGGLSNTQSFVIVVNPSNQAPIVEATNGVWLPVWTVTLPGTLNLSGAAIDDGKPSGATLTVTWSEQSGPGNVTFGTPTVSAPESTASSVPVLNVTTASFSAPGTYVLTLTGNDTALSGSDSLTVVVSPAAGTPAITSVNPNTGQQGQQSISVAITGQNTNFVQGTTTATFGAGITVVSLTVNTPTTATAVINIDPAAALGTRDVILTTNAEVATSAAGFTVGAGTVSQPPTITSQPPKARTWVKQSPTGTPPSPRAPWEFFNVYDSVNDRMMFFGGEVSAQIGTTCGDVEAPADVWVLANASASKGTPTWIEFNPPAGPQGRFEHVLAYSQSTNRLIVQGGGIQSQSSCTQVLADTWVLTNANGMGGSPVWTQLPDIPSPRETQASFYDEVSNTLIVFGGKNQSNSYLNDVWVLSNANGVGNPAWSALSPTGGPPAPRAAASLAYDAATNRLVVFGGQSSAPSNLNDVWVLTNANGTGGTPQWLQLSPGGTLPAPRSLAYLRYDPSSNQAILRGNPSSGFGSALTFSEDGIWILSNANGLGGTPQWTQFFPAGEPPEMRDFIAAAYQPASDRTIIAMGEPGGWVFANDVWVLTQPTPSVNVTQTFTYQVSATDPNAGTVLTFSLDSAPPGMTIDPASGLILWTPNLSQAGTYSMTVRVTDTLGLSATQTFDLIARPINQPPIVENFPVNPITLPNTASLFGRVFDDGNPPNSTLSFTWSEVSGPGSVAFSNPAGPIANGDPNGMTSGTASFSNAGTYVIRLAVSDGQLTGSEDISIVVNSPSGTPAIVSVNPNTGQQGQQSLSVAITGQNTHFVQGTTQVDLGAGVTVNSLTVTDATDLAATISIDPAATLGSRTVTVTTGSEVVSLANGFTITTSSLSPTITTISPNSGQQGQGGPIGIVGLSTHFAQGATQVDLGTGVTVTGVTVACPTCLTAQATIAANAPVGPHNVTVTTGTEVAALTNGFTVQAGTPLITSLNHASIQQGQTESLTITAQFTHFAQGTTLIDLGAGITVTAVTVSSPTSVTAQITADVAAAVGTRTLTVTTGTEVVTLTNVFNVTANTPLITTLNPGSGQQGQQNLAVGITGAFTHFVQGTTQPSFGAGITVASLTVTSSTSATAVVNIDPAAAVGLRTVTLTTGSEVASFVNGFTVGPPTPIIQSLNPGGTSQGAQNFSVSITGFDTHWVQGTTAAGFGAGITVVSLSVTNATSATAVINVDPAAVIGPRTVTLTTGSEVASFVNGFSIVAGIPGITQINPGGGPQGAQNLSVAVTAQFTHWVQGTTTANFGAGVTVVSLTITSSTTATVVVNVDPAAALGARTVTFTTGTEVEQAPGGFTISASAPALTQVSPSAGQQGQQSLSVTITGQNTHFLQGTTTANFGAGITVASLTVASSTSATAVLNIDPAAATGGRVVTLTTGTEIASLANGFTVTPGTPVLTQVNPNTGLEGQQYLPVTITGQFTNFVQGTSQVNFGAGITVSTVSVSSPTSLTAQINISANAGLGARAVTVTTGSEVDTLVSGFNVQGPTGPVSVSPGSGMQGQSLSVTITAQGANFVQGTTQARFGPGVIVGSGIAGGFGPVTVTSPTTATAQLTILASALPASRNVTVQTSTNQLTGLNGFVVVGLPTLSAISPNHANQGQTITVTIGGTYTNFVQGTTQVSFGPGISVGGGPSGGFGPVTVNSSISATVQINVDPAATLGLRTVVAQTGSEQASAVNGFSVLTSSITGPAPVVTITSPAEASDVTAPTTVTGTVTSPNLDYWTLAYQAPTASSFTQFATGTTSSVTGTFDPTLLLNGTAVIQLTGVDTSGQTTSTTVTVVVTRNLKIGNFTVSFNDLTIPVAGLPIQVVRTYDSRFKGNGDFGIGWRLDLSAAQITENVALGDQWNETSTGGGLATYCVQLSTPHKVTVSLSDGTTYEFVPNLSPQCQQFVPIQGSQVSVTFTPTGITPPNAVLAIAGNNQPFVEGAVPGPVTLTDLDNVTIFDPDQYILTLPDGRALQISRTLGLQSITDLNGNKLTVTATGITSSTGKSVTFARDAQSRFQTITDPNGNQVTYTYDSNGDLASFKDQAGNTSTYTYDSNHDLLTIVDPRGVQPIRNDYDANGRLVSHTDAFGNVINYDHDTANNQEIVTDRLGNVTVNEYDSAGNIVKITDALGGVTTRTYDGNGNVLTETNALNETRTNTYDANNNRLTETDPLSHTTTYTYNSRNQVLTITDALNRVTTNIYDANGNLLSTQDPAGNTTSYTYNSQGLRSSMTDPLNNVTSYQYDGSGNLTQQTDALTHVTTYTYDSNGNKLTETRTRTTTGGQQTLLTSYQYDGLNRVTQTTYPDGSTTQIQYNSIGKQGVTTDQLNRQTSYQYDLMGRLTQTTYPDSTTASSTYDAEGDRISSTDRGGRTTTYVYDPLKRLTQTKYADGSTTSTGYDAIGEVTSVKDPLGNVSQYQYDAAGRRTQVTDALSHVTTFAYDQVGNQLSMTDSNTNTTQYQYDNNNRRTKVIYPDTTTDTTAYDALGRTVSKTGQAGLTTQFAYDKLGRLTQVTDALTQVTSYTYDEVGNRITQTDANTHTTTFAYDQLGRRTQRTLPVGMSETYTYDAAGNLKTKTDFNAKTTTYTHDSSNRLSSKVPDASFSAPTVSFTYTATGQRQSMTDASGTTNYIYDLRDRLTQKATPEGTLAYLYDVAGNLTSIQSSNASGTSVNYAYDALNRLSSVKDQRLTAGTTSYAYDNVGNLSGYRYPNGVQSTYLYNTLNRLTNVGIANGSGTIASYAYTLGQAGNRTAVAEFGGRQVNYTYDSLYRLTGEAITGSADTTKNGTVGYTYDPVGNRLQRTSTLAPVPAASYTYDANDRLTTDTYDANGNTTASAGNAYTYDFENHLTALNTNAETIVYDGDGNRVAKTAGGVTTQYLVDDRNLTGYAQVLEEISGGTVQRVYTYGLNRISQSQASGTGFYGYDGHGNVRILTDTTGAVTDRYDYDAFGSILTQTGSTPNVYLYSGEQLDPNVGFYYMRSRYYKADGGRFVTSDSWFGKVFEPGTLHKYAYVANNPVNLVDPSGKQFSVPELALTGTIIGILNATYVALNERALGHSLATVKGKLFSAFVFGFAVGASAYGLVSYTEAAFAALVATLGTYGAPGLADPAINTAIADTMAAGRWAHAASDLVNEGILATEADLIPIVHQVLSNPQATQAIKLGADQATAYAAQVNIGGFTYWVAVSVFNSGALDGQIGSAVLPTLSQLGKALPPGIFF